MPSLKVFRYWLSNNLNPSISYSRCWVGIWILIVAGSWLGLFVFEYLWTTMIFRRSFHWKGFLLYIFTLWAVSLTMPIILSIFSFVYLALSHFSHVGTFGADYNVSWAFVWAWRFNGLSSRTIFGTLVFSTVNGFQLFMNDSVFWFHALIIN